MIYKAKNQSLCSDIIIIIVIIIIVVIVIITNYILSEFCEIVHFSLIYMEEFSVVYFVCSAQYFAGAI